MEAERGLVIFFTKLADFCASEETLVYRVERDRGAPRGRCKKFITAPFYGAVLLPRLAGGGVAKVTFLDDPP